MDFEQVMLTLLKNKMMLIQRGQASCLVLRLIGDVTTDEVLELINNDSKYSVQYQNVPVHKHKVVRVTQLFFD